MITANVIHRVFRIAIGSQVGSGFTIDVEGKQYLVTARHIARELKESGQLSVFGKGQWSTTHAQVVGHGTGDVDISVFALDTPLTPEGLPLGSSSDGLIYGQDVHFLGFPYNILPGYIFGDEGYPLPLVKKAIVSAFDKDLYLLDGHNNPGFSGGPVVFRPQNGRDFSVAAVISGFRAVDEPVLLEGEKTDLTYEYNTGIIVAYKSEHAVELIRNESAPDT